MWRRQIIVAITCLLVLQQVTAVVNSGASQAEDKAKTSSVENSESTDSASSNAVPDSVAASSDETVNRREASLSIADTYGPPVPVDTYLPSATNNINLPVPVYGVPDSPNNVVYPAPPPDIPPPLPLQGYGAPQPVPSVPLKSYGSPLSSNHIGIPSGSYGVPANNYGPPSIGYGVPNLNPPKLFFPRGHKPKHSYGPPKHSYGPPSKPLFNPKKHFPKGNYRPKPVYGPPSVVNIPSKIHSNFGQSFASHGSHSISTQYGAPVDTSFLNIGHPISNQYGAPDFQIHTSAHYGPPQPSPNPKPPHPGAPAPPTPPDIKYDGWQPIPGLVSRRPSDTYGVPPSDNHLVGDLSYNNDLSPPPAVGHSIAQDVTLTGSTAGHDIASLALTSNFNKGQTISDSYGAPLNTVTGSGGVVSSSGDDIRGSNQHGHQDSLALGLSGLNLGQEGGIQSVKSIGYEIFPNGNGINSISSSGGVSDSYGAPPLNSYSPNGPYAAAHSYSNLGLSFGSSHSSHSSHISHGNRGYKGLSLSSSGIGLIPPSGVYGAPSGHAGTPLFSGSKFTKHPVSFAQNNHIESSHSHSASTVYLPPVTTNIVKPPEPTNLYSLPAEHSSISFQNLAHGSSTQGLSSFSSGLQIEGAQAQALTSYNVPLGIVDGSYSSSNQDGLAVSLDHSHPTLNIDLTGGLLNGGNLQSASYLHTSVPHDCSLHSSQPLPSLSYGVPSANSYTASLASLTTNIGGSYNQANNVIVPHSTYGVPDQNSAHSQNTETRINGIETDEKEVSAYGKSVAESFGPNSELIKSQSLDLNNIPLQGNLGSYTLQIQSSDGQIPQSASHSQVLNEGLLQSILSAIEHPQQNGGSTIINAPAPQYLPVLNQTLDVRHVNGYPEIQADPETSPSEKVVATAEDKDAEVAESKNEEVNDEGLSILENNDIALYYSNDNERYKKQTVGEGNKGENIKSEEKEVVTNGH